MYIRGQLKDVSEVPRSSISRCWFLEDMFAFENVGFCREVESTIKVSKLGEVHEGCQHCLSRVH